MHGEYLTKFNENINMLRDLMDEILSKSSLWRYGVLLGAGGGESDYQGSLGALLQIVNPYGTTLWEDARIAHSSP